MFSARMVIFSFCSPIMPRDEQDIVSTTPRRGGEVQEIGGTVSCRAVDPPSEHSQPETAKPPPGYPVIVSCSCCGTALRYSPTRSSRASRYLAPRVLSTRTKRRPEQKRKSQMPRYS